jgi:putative transcriptional regulator
VPVLVLALVLALLAATALAAEPPAHSEPAQGQLLIASPDIADPRFRETVILVVRHDPEGAFGLVINRPVEERTIASLLAATGTPDDTVEGKMRIFAGGPVQPERGFVLHSPDYRREGSVEIDEHVAMTASPEILRDIGHHKGPERALFLLGYAGWGPGQLESEIDRGDWFAAPGEAGLIFEEERGLLWRHALARRLREL